MEINMARHKKHKGGKLKVMGAHLGHKGHKGGHKKGHKRGGKKR
jgi:hypothetical protein